MVWTVQVEGGLGFDASSTFGWHSFLMSLAFPVFLTEAVLLYSAPIVPDAALPVDKGRRRTLLRSLHVVLHSLSLICAILALVGIASYKHLNEVGEGSSSQLGSQFEIDGFTFPFFTLFTPHSWIGVATLLLWGVQAGLRLAVYAVPSMAAAVGRWHAFLGKAIYVSALAACAMGFMDMQSSDLGGADGMQYPPFSASSQMACAAAFLLLLLGMFVFAVPGLQKEFRQPPTSSTETEKAAFAADNIQLTA